MRVSLLLLLLLLVSGCSTKIPNTWSHRVEKNIVSDIKLHVDIRGEGSPLILLHGFGLSNQSFRHIIKPLSKHYKVYNFDLKGFGNSPKIDDDRYSPYDQAILIQNFIKQNNLKDISLLGHSYGGGIALSLALMNQKRISKMVLISPTSYKQNLPSLIKWMQKPIIGFIGYYLLPSSYKVKESYKFAYYDKEKISQEDINISVRNFKKNGAKNIFYNASFDLIPDDIDETSKRYKTIEIPTLIIWGDKDVVIPKHRGYRLRKDLKNAKLKIIENCGHIPQQERPYQVLKYLLDFL